MFDPNEFLSDYGIRSVSAYHRDHPYVYEAGGRQFMVKYLPRESDTVGLAATRIGGLIWFPVNYMGDTCVAGIRYYYGETFTVECPTGSGHMYTGEAAQNLVGRLNQHFPARSGAWRTPGSVGR